MASPDKAKLLSKTLERLRARLKPAAIPVGPLGAGPAAEEPTPSSAPSSDQSPDAGTSGNGGGSPNAGGANGTQPGPDIFHGDPVLRELVRSFLIWESTTAKADAALKKIASAVVDVNEFRVCLPAEMAAIIGHNYPRIEDRIAALRATLNEIFKRENRLRLSHLPTMSKKAANAYLDSLNQTPAGGFVADRVALVCCQIHALPVDSRIAEVLEKAKVADKGVSIEETAAAATRLLKAGEARDAYALLQAAADEAPVTMTRIPKPAKPAPAKAARPKPKATSKKSK